MAFIPRDDTSVLGRWWWTVDRWSVVGLLLLMGFGAVMAFAASPSVALRENFEQFHLANRHILYLGASLTALFVCSLFNLSTVRKLGLVGILVSIVLLIAVLVLGEADKGAKRWLSFGFADLQPSEIAKPLFAVCVAWLFALDRSTNLRWPLVVQLLMLGVMLLLLMLQPDVGQSIVILAIWGAQFFVAGYNLLWVAGGAVIAALAFTVAYIREEHVRFRIQSFFDPEVGDQYQVTRSLEAFIEGGLFGKGPGEGVSKALVPDVHADFVFAAMGEEFGMVACVLVVSIFLILILRSLLRLMRSNNLFVIVAGVGFLTQFGFQAVINMSTALNLMPTKGMTLPFISYGGSSMLGMAITMGLLLAITRRRPKWDEG